MKMDINIPSGAVAELEDTRKQSHAPAHLVACETGPTNLSAHSIPAQYSNDTRVP